MNYKLLAKRLRAMADELSKDEDVFRQAKIGEYQIRIHLRRRGSNEYFCWSILKNGKTENSSSACFDRCGDAIEAAFFQLARLIFPEDAN